MSIYIYNGTEYSEEDVIAAAEQKGMDVNSYINKFGIKKANQSGPGKKMPAGGTNAPAAGKNTGSKSVPYSSASSDNPFGKVKLFDPLNITKNALDNARIQKTKKAPVTIDEPKSSYTKLDFSALDNTQKASNFREYGMSEEFKVKKAKEAEAKRNDELLSLQKLKNTAVRNRKDYKEAIDLISKAEELDDDFITELDADIQSQKERNGKMATVTTPSGGVAGFGGGGGGVESSYKFLAFPEERKEIINEFKKQNKKYTEADVVNLAADLYKSKKQKQRVYNQKYDAMEDLDGYSDDVQSFVKDYTKNEDQVTDINLAKVVVQKNYTQAAIEKKAKEQASLEAQLKPADYKFSSEDEIIKQNELIKKINTGRQELKSSFDHYKSLDEAEGKLDNKSTTLKQDVDLLNKEWGWWSRTGLKTLNAFSSLGGGIAGGLAYLADLGVQAGTLGTWDNSFGNYISEKAKSNRESFEEQVAKPRDKFYSIESIGEGAADAILNQLPIIATAAAAPEVFAPELVGLGIGLVSGTGSKYTSMLEEQKYGSFDKEGNKTMPQYNSAQLMAVPLLFGAFEGGSEYVGGRAFSRSLNKWQQLMGKATDKEVDLLLSGVKKSIQKQSSEFATALLHNYGEELPSEVINQVLGNVVDNVILGKKDIEPLDGVSDVIFDTSVVSTLFGTAPHIAGAVYKNFIPKSDVASLMENNSRIADMLKGIDFEKLSKEEEAIINSKVSALKDSSSKIINNIAGMIGTTDTQDLLDLNNVSKQMIDLKKQAQIINNSSNFSEEQKKAALSEMKSQYKELNSVYNERLSRAYRQERAYKKANSFLNNRRLNKDIKLGNNFSAGILLENPNATFEYADSKTIVDSMMNDPATFEELEKKAKAIETLDIKNGVEKYSPEQLLFTQRAIASEAVNSNGWFDQNTNKIYVNKSKSLKEGRFNTARHEFFHKLTQNFGNNMESIGTALYDFVEKSHSGPKDFKKTDFYKRMEQEKYDLNNKIEKYEGKTQSNILGLKKALDEGKISQSDFNAGVKLEQRNLDIKVKAERNKTYEEVSTILTESLEEKDIQIAKDANTALKLDENGNVILNNAKDVFNFIVAYNESFSKTKSSESIEAANKGKVAGELIKEAPAKSTGDQIKLSKPQSEILKERLEELKDNEDEYDMEDFEQQVNNLKLKIKNAIEKEKSAPKVETVKKEVLTEEDEVKEIIKENKSSVASDKVQRIYDAKGKEGAQEIINLFKPITKKIVDKRRDAPDFDRELLTDEIETGVGGILDLITKYNPESGIPLAAYINKYLPVRAIATSKRLLGKEFSKDVTEEKSLVAEETVSETKEKPKYDNALESKVFEPEELESINKKILSVIRTLKSKIDAPISINRTVTPLIAEIKDEIGKQVDINVKTAMGGKKDNQLKNWLLKNKKYILENMTTTWLMGKGKANKVEGGIPNAIQKRIDGRWVSYPEWVGKTPDRESVSTDQAGRTSGAELVRRLPNAVNNVSNEEFLSHILEASGNPLRGRKESLAKAIAEEASFDIIMDDFKNQGPIFDAFLTNQERLGIETENILVEDFNRQVERGNIKFSKALKNKIADQLNENMTDDKVTNIITGMISQMIQPTISKRNRAVLDIEDTWKEKLGNDLYEEIYNEYLAPITDALETIQETASGLRGDAAEKEVIKTINSINNKNFKVISTEGAGRGSHDIDVVFTYKNVPVKLEIKSGKSDRLTSLNIHNYTDKNTITVSRNINNENRENVTSQVIENEKFNRFVKKAMNLGASLTQNGSIEVTPAQFRKLTSKESIYKQTLVPLKLSTNIIEDIYSGKGVNYIGFGDIGMFYVGENPLDLKIPKLEGSLYSKAFLHAGKLKTNGKISLTLKAYTQLTTKAGNELSEKSNSSIYSPESINNLFSNSNIKFSKGISHTFNKIIEENKGVEDYKNFSDIVARRRGAGKNKFDIYVPASAADFELLLYNFMGEGKKGEEQKKFFNDTLLKPYANGNDLMDAARQSIKNEYKQLLNEFPDVAKKIEKRTPDGDFTYDQAIRVAMWNDEGVEIPGLSQRDMNKLTDLVNSDPELKAFKDALIVTGRQGRGWIKPEEYWDANTIITDLHNLTEGEGRKKFLSEFITNAAEMFGSWENGKLVGPNINKVEAVYGTDVREALEDVLYRMTTGKNRGYGKDKETSAWANWVSGSTGAIMFLNVRSAALQLIGAVNFLNLRDNNPYAAAKAFANQKQYWEDFATIWNSDKMRERRGGLKEDVAAAEIANAAAGSKNKVGAVLSYLLKIGYTPTQMADSFAIASGGAPFYRNRIKSYLKEGMSEMEAEEAAWDDFTKVSDETQQSGDPRDISKQQASPAGRLLLTFQNTAMQQSRIVKKAFLDIKNRRGDDKTNFAKIAYYIAVQNTMFAVLQQGLFAVAFSDDDEDKEKSDKEKKLDDKLFDVADGVVDTILRGTGFLGGIVATVKNMAKKYLDERDKKFKADYTKVVLEGANLSPPIGSKLRKLYSGLQQTKFDKDLIKARGWDVMQDGRVNLGPMYGITGKLVEAGTNVPMDRLVTKINNASEAMNSQNTAMQRIMVGLGWSTYSAGIEDSAGDKKIREEAKAKRKIEGKVKAKETRERTKDSISKLPLLEQARIKEEKLAARRRRKMG